VFGEQTDEMARGYTSGWDLVLAPYVERAGG
jgi:hypothetical protein